MESSLVSRAEKILAQPDHNNAATFLSQFCRRDRDGESAKNLYRFCSKNFPNCLTLTLLKVYKFSEHDLALRSQCLTLLHTHLDHLYHARIQLAPEAFPDIKKLLVSCLVVQEISDANFKILSKIMFFVALDVFLLDNTWDELCLYITELTGHDLWKALSVFNALPAILDEDSLMMIVKKLFPLILKCLNSQSCSTEEWILALESGLTIAIMLVNARRDDLSGNISYAILSSSSDLVKNGKEATVRSGLRKLMQKMDVEVDRFRKKEYSFVSNLVLKMESMKGTGEDTKAAVRTIKRILQERYWDIESLCY